MKKYTSDRYLSDVGAVMATRLTLLPMMWMVAPRTAARETRRMFSEKEDACNALQQQLMLAPMTFWLDLWQGILEGDRDGGLSRARGAAERRFSQPYTSRVRANKRRLTRRI